MIPGVSAICQSVRLRGVRSSLQHVVRNIESKNVLVSFSLAFYLTVHGIRPYDCRLTPIQKISYSHLSGCDRRHTENLVVPPRRSAAKLLTRATRRGGLRRILPSCQNCWAAKRPLAFDFPALLPRTVGGIADWRLCALRNWSILGVVSPDGERMATNEFALRYRLHAAHCVELAERISDAEGRSALLAMAKSWLALAEQAVKK